MKAEQQNIKRLLNTAKGQIDGLNKMIDDDKYCIDISNQIMATIAILKKVNIEILDAHLKCCVLHADDRERETKINEISDALRTKAVLVFCISPFLSHCYTCLTWFVGVGNR